MDQEEERMAKALGQALRALRKARGLSQAELSERVDLSPDYVGELERGLKLPSLVTAARLARLFGTSIDHLLGADTESDGAWNDRALRLLRALPDGLRAPVLAMLEAATRMDKGKRK